METVAELLLILAGTLEDLAERMPEGDPVAEVLLTHCDNVVEAMFEALEFTPDMPDIEAGEADDSLSLEPLTRLNTFVDAILLQCIGATYTEMLDLARDKPSEVPYRHLRLYERLQDVMDPQSNIRDVASVILDMPEESDEDQTEVLTDVPPSTLLPDVSVETPNLSSMDAIAQALRSPVSFPESSEPFIVNQMYDLDPSVSPVAPVSDDSGIGFISDSSRQG